MIIVNITELKALHGERVINLVVSDIVVSGLAKLMDSVKQGKIDKDNPLNAAWVDCLTNINGSKWDDIRAIIKRSL